MWKLHLIFIQFHLVSLCLANYSVFDNYQNYESITTYLESYVNNNSDLMTMYSIGESVLRRQLWVVQITAAKQDETLPNIKIVANIHGNEPVGREMSLKLITFLKEEYRAGNPRIRWLLSSTKIHILPCMNPDGFETALSDHHNQLKGRSNKCDLRGRTNERQIDLNKNFPGIFRNNTCPQQPESRAIMKWMDDIPFVLSLSLHSGYYLVNYPFDDTPEAESQGLNYSPTPDDDVFRAMALSYSRAHMSMSKMDIHRNGPTKGVENGIINGAMWYPINGGMQDYNYVYHGCMELTIELEVCRFPRYATMWMNWKENSEAILTWTNYAHRGVKGTLRDVCSSKPISKAELMIMGRNSSFWSSKSGHFWRTLLPGNYQLQIQAPGYEKKLVPFTVPKVELDKKYDFKPALLSIDLIPLNETKYLSSNCSYFLTRTAQRTSNKTASISSTSTTLDDSQQKNESTLATVSEPNTKSLSSKSFTSDEVSNSTDATETTTLHFRVGASTNCASRGVFILPYFFSFIILTAAPKMTLKCY